MYKQQCIEYLTREYGLYENDFSNVLEEQQLIEAQNAGQTPEQYIDYHAKKLDLTRISEMDNKKAIEFMERFKN